MLTTLGLIGAGNIGSTVARLALDAGIDVVLSNSRGPDTLGDLVAELGEHAHAATPAEAAQVGQLVVVSVPFGVYRDLPAEALAGRTVIDTTNYYPDRDGHVAELDAGTVTSSELVQQHLAGAHVVKAFNNIDFVRLGALARPAAAPDRSALTIAGDDPDAMTQVTGLLNTLGYDVVDIGELADSWRSQPDTPVYVNPYLPPQLAEPPADAYAWFRDAPGVVVPAARIRELVKAATRS
jgi:predicted dinucleotide-binding enzyme